MAIVEAGTWRSPCRLEIIMRALFTAFYGIFICPKCQNNERLLEFCSTPGFRQSKDGCHNMFMPAHAGRS